MIGIVGIVGMIGIGFIFNLSSCWLLVVGCWLLVVGCWLWNAALVRNS